MYRWLMLSYPRDYRRTRGAEILDTVRDIGPRRNGLRIAANLVRHGLRTRLGRPASRTVVAWAAIFTVACGLFAASFGTWMAWLDSRPLDHRELAAAVDQLYPDHAIRHIDTVDPPAVFIIYGNPLTWNSVSDLLLGDGGEYELADITASFWHLPSDDRSKVLADLQQRLAAAGWDTAEPVYSNAYDCIPGDARCDPASIPSNITVLALRGDNLMEVHINADNTSPLMDFTMTRATPGSTVPAGIAGFVLGTAGGWLLFGWASRRTEHGHPLARGWVRFLYGCAMFLWWAPILLAAPEAVVRSLGQAQLSQYPLWEWLGQPTFSLFFLVGCAALILVLALAALPARHPVDQRLASG